MNEAAGCLGSKAERDSGPPHTPEPNPRGTKGKKERKGKHFPHTGTRTQNLNLAQNPARRCCDVEGEERPDYAESRHEIAHPLVRRRGEIPATSGDAEKKGRRTFG